MTLAQLNMIFYSLYLCVCLSPFLTLRELQFLFLFQSQSGSSPKGIFQHAFKC